MVRGNSGSVIHDNTKAMILINDTQLREDVTDWTGWVWFGQGDKA